MIKLNRERTRSAISGIFSDIFKDSILDYIEGVLDIKITSRVKVYVELLDRTGNIVEDFAEFNKLYNCFFKLDITNFHRYLITGLDFGTINFQNPPKLFVTTLLHPSKLYILDKPPGDPRLYMIDRPTDYGRVKTGIEDLVRSFIPASSLQTVVSEIFSNIHVDISPDVLLIRLSNADYISYRNNNWYGQVFNTDIQKLSSIRLPILNYDNTTPFNLEVRYKND